MPEQCPCAQLDWSDVDQTKDHHPDCKGEQTTQWIDPTANVRGFDYSFYSREYEARSREVRGPEHGEPAVLLVRPELVETARRIVDSRQREHLTIPRTIDELIAAMESMFEVGEPGESSFAVTGEPFFKYGIGYRICLDAPVRDYIKLKLGAITACWNTARELREKHGPGAVLYWREKLTLREEHDFDRDELIGQVTMRLLISDKPPISTSLPSHIDS